MSTIFEQLRDDAGGDWTGHVDHRFVRALGAGTLPAASFRHYLVQDTLFLHQFARAYALAAFKSDTAEEMRAATATLHGLLTVELPLHLRFCACWGLDAGAMAAAPEALETIAYTRFVLDRGLAGDRLDLEAALAPCVLGYAAIGRALAPDAERDGHPYREWIGTYAGDAYQAVAMDAGAALERSWSARGSPGRYAALLATFRQACRLEAAFWSMGYAAAATTL